MKILKAILILAVLAAIAFAVWKYMPGVRTKVESTVDRYGGWTEEARREDPVGFLEHAEGKMSADLDAFKQAKRDLADARSRAQEELEKTEGLRDAAASHSLDFRGAYRAAASGDAFPVQVAGASYSRDDLVSQVRLLLLQQGNYAEVANSYHAVLDTVDERENDLEKRILGTKAALTNLAAQKELVRIQKLTEETDELMRQVQELLGQNSEVLEELDSPVRTVEELLRSGGGRATPVADSAATDDDVMAFPRPRRTPT